MMTKIKSSKKAKVRSMVGVAVVVALLLVFACKNKQDKIEHFNNIENELQLKLGSNEQFLVLIDGEIADKDAMMKLSPGNIKLVNIINENLDSLVSKYGDIAQKGIVEITLKSADTNTNIQKNQIDELAVVGFGNQTKLIYDDVVDSAEIMPEFSGGDLALRKFITDAIRYPIDAMYYSIQGKVFVSFVIEKDGSVGRVRIAQGVDPLLDLEAIRVVKSLPKWKPGVTSGKPIPVSYTIPINFVLQ